MEHRSENTEKYEIPVIAFSAWSGTGKTTIIEKLIASLKKRGLRVAAVKHDAHDFEIDREGKDSWRFTQAGADVTVISSKEKTALIAQRSLTLSEILTGIRDVDIIIAEGFNQEDLPRIGISRLAAHKGFRLPLHQYIAVVTDEYLPGYISIDSDPAGSAGSSDDHSAPSFSASAGQIPVLALDDTEGLTCFILQYFQLQ